MKLAEKVINLFEKDAKTIKLGKVGEFEVVGVQTDSSKNIDFPIGSYSEENPDKMVVWNKISKRGLNFGTYQVWNKGFVAGGLVKSYEDGFKGDKDDILKEIKSRLDKFKEKIAKKVEDDRA